MDLFQCPLPMSQYPKILLGHGGGGRLTQELIEKVFVPAFKNRHLEARHDGATIEIGTSRIAFTTDSYVVKPLFFRGGDIGCLSVYGTANDLAMCGAKPLYLSAGVILEEGFEMAELVRVIESMKKAAARCEMDLVTGDTKVVDRGKGDGIFISTSGIGVVPAGRSPIGPSRVEPGDSVIVSGDLGRHGIAIMAEREGLAFETAIESDCGPLAGLVEALFKANVCVHCLRDLTRGGLASALNEIASVRNVSVELEEMKIPVTEGVRGACEMLGLDPLYVANEGRFVLFCPKEDASRALEVLKTDPMGKEAAYVGTVKAQGEPVVVRNAIGTRRILDLLSGEQLPRIC